MRRFLEKLKGVKPRDIGHIFLFLLALPAALIYKRFRKNLWLICDNGKEAADNGYWLFKYIRENHPEQDCVFAVYNDSPDFKKVSALGSTVRYASFKHWLLYLTARVNISSQKSGKPNYAVCYLLEVYGILRNNRVFLQHGIILTDIEFLYYKNTRMSMFMTGTRREYEYVSSQYGYPDGTVKLTGLARFDNLHDFRTVSGQILIMPTWRDWLGTSELAKNAKGELAAFRDSEYCKRWSSVVQSKRLEEICRKYGCTVMFFPHRDTQRFMSCFKSDNPYLKLCSLEEQNVQELMKSSAFMITDYSSVQADFAYMKKPLAYYQFDYDRYSAEHYHKGYFDYKEDGFGPVFRNEDDLINYIEDMAKDSFQNREPYIGRHSDFFTLYDNENCKRNYNEIKARWG